MAPAWDGWLPANAVRVRLGLRLGLGGGSPSRSVLASSSLYTKRKIRFNMGSSAIPPMTNKNTALNGGMPSLLCMALLKTVVVENVGTVRLV